MTRRAVSLTIIFRRPTDPNKRYSNREIPATTKLGTEIFKQYIYLKVNLSTKIVKARLDGLKAHTFTRPKHTAAYLKRRLLYGTDLRVDSTVDLIEVFQMKELRRSREGVLHRTIGSV